MHTKPIPAEVLTAYTVGLSAYIDGLTPTGLVAALQAFDPGEAERIERNAAPPRMLPLEEAAQSLALSTCTVRRMVKSGKLAGQKVGGQWRVPLSAVKALAEVPEV